MYTQNIETPLMIIQGDKDFVSIEQGEEIFTHLYRHGKRQDSLDTGGKGTILMIRKKSKGCGTKYIHG